MIDGNEPEGPVYMFDELEVVMRVLYRGHLHLR